VSNLELWKSVEETAPGFTKTGDLDGRKVTSINGTYMVKRATEAFGPIGKDWGYEIEDEQFQPGAQIKHGGEVIGHAVMHTLKVRLWYMQDDKKCEVVHFGHTPYIRGTHYGAMTDFDAPKKSLTDAIKKCLSMIGFSADVFLGLYDDTNYVEAAKIRETVKNADDAEEEMTKARTEFSEWLKRETDTYAKVPNAAPLRLMYQGHLKKAERQCAVLGVDFQKVKVRIDAAYNEQMDKLIPPVDLVCHECGAESVGRPDTRCPDCGSAKRGPAEPGKDAQKKEGK
jgi:rubrerythrin